MIRALPKKAWMRISWRRGTKGDLKADFAAVRVRLADGPLMSHAQHLPGEVAWLVCEKRASGETRYYVANHGPRTRLRTLVRLIRARWSCEQAHQQLKNELGLDHFEGRSWTGLHRDALLSMIAYCFLQHLRLGGKTGRMRLSRTGPPPSPSLPQVRRSLLAMLLTWGQTCPYCQRPIRHPARE